MRVLSIDPGAVSGAWAFWDGPRVTVGDLPMVERQVEPGGLMRMIKDWKPDCAVVERVASMPGQGVASTFKFGFAAGCIQGVLTGAGIPLRLVAPTVWKREVGVPGGKDKEPSRALALRLYPSVEGLDLKKHQNRAEALLIGHWFLLQGAQNFIAAVKGGGS